VKEVFDLLGWEYGKILTKKGRSRVFREKWTCCVEGHRDINRCSPHLRYEEIQGKVKRRAEKGHSQEIAIEMKKSGILSRKHQDEDGGGAKGG